ncbi:MAG: glycosyltransferase [Ruminococcaceae bacterium]|nr:glycosyltransferase [Oscillospiraceae bacterium]
MKNILIVADSLTTGGLEKTLIDLCDNLDYSKYSVDLYLFNEGRDLLPQLNKSVNLLPDSPFFSTAFNRPFGISFKTLLKQKQFSLASYRILRFVKSRLKINVFSKTDWHFQKKTMLKINKKYDIAIGFAEGSAGYYVADCVDAKVKNVWIHTDIKQITTNKALDIMAFEKAHNICTVSQNSKNSLCELYPQFKDKIKVFTLPSLFDFSKIEKLANETCEMNKNTINIVSVGRLVELKGFHLCIEPCKKLVDEGYHIKWYICGDGPQRNELEILINQQGLENNFILLGNQSNPYKYIKNSAFCVQPSSYEGFSLVVYEQKLLSKCVICTPIKSNLEMISDQENGIVVSRDSESIYTAVKSLLDNPSLLKKLSETPSLNFITKKETIERIEATFNDQC